MGATFGFWRGYNHCVHRFSSHCWEQGSYFAESWQSWPPRASHRASAAFTMAAAVMWLPAPTVSRMDGGRRTRNIARKRSLSGETIGGRCCFNFPMRTLGLKPYISMGRHRIAICSFRTARAKCFSNSQTVCQTHCRHLTDLECTEGLAWAGWLGHWRTSVF